jgi:hypothetical protein
MRRFALYFLPATATAAMIIGVFYGWIGFQAVRGGAGWAGYLLLAFGIGGVALGAGLLNVWRKVMGRARQQPYR